jgi:ketosteroid isomerase-like protein
LPSKQQTNRNKAAARAEFEIWSTGRLDQLDELVAPDVVHHDPYDPNASDGLAGLKRSIETNRSLFPDMTIEVNDQVAEADRVATRWVARMTHPEAGPIEMNGITIERFEGGKVVESWRSMDFLGLLRKTGALPEV